MNPARSRDGLAAGVLAAAVHGFFVLLLVLGVSWQIHDAQPVMADIWQSLPEPARAEPEPVPLPKPQAKPQPAPDNRAAEIALEKKKQREAEELKRRQAEEEAAKKQREEAKRQEQAREQKIAEAKRRDELRRQEEALRQQSLAQALAAEDSQLKARDAAAVAAAQRASETDKLVTRYTDMISARIRENTRLPENLAGNPQAEFKLAVLPSGDIAKITLTRSSGNPAYDQAVLRGIEKSSPLPLPAERAAMERFRDLRITHKARE